MRNLETRARTMAAIRRFFQERGYLEVDTPLRVPAVAPEAFIEPYRSEEWYLQTSPEPCMKRLLCAGLERIYQICKCFRRAERGHRHLPEFTMLEWYRAGAGYREGMDECEALIRSVARDVLGQGYLSAAGRRVDLSAPFHRITVEEAFSSMCKIPAAGAISEGRFDECMAFTIEPGLPLDRPVFLYDYPAEKAALARTAPDDPSVGQRFELYIAGIELANAFSELTDPVEQRRRFEQELKRRESAGEPPLPLPGPFLQALKHMPDSFGAALGVDRLVMILADASDIDDVTSFTPEEL